MRHALTVAAVALIVPAVACTGLPAEGLGPAPLTPTERFVLQTEQKVDQIALAVHDRGLSPNQQAALFGLAQRYSWEGEGYLRIAAPMGDDPSARDMAYAVAAYVEEIGLSRDAIHMTSYEATDPRAPILVDYQGMAATVPECGREWTNLTRTANNQSQANFGCAVTANMAAQIANPRDIGAPRDMTPGDANRRASVFDNYRSGQATSAAQEPLVGQNVAQAVE